MVEPVTQREKAYRGIREGIINHRWSDGTRLVEREVCEILNLSRTPIREAFNRLEKEGLLEHVPKWGVFTKKFNKKEILEMYEVREGLEGVAVRLAAQRSTPDDLEKMEWALKKMEAVLKNGKGKAVETHADEYNRADNEFHSFILEASRNRLLIDLASRCHIKVAEVPKESAGANYTRSEWTRILKEHRDILNCLKSGNVVQGERNLRKHIAKGKLAAERIL